MCTSLWLIVFIFCYGLTANYGVEPVDNDDNDNDVFKAFSLSSV